MGGLLACVCVCVCSCGSSRELCTNALHKYFTEVFHTIFSASRARGCAFVCVRLHTSFSQKSPTRFFSASRARPFQPFACRGVLPCACVCARVCVCVCVCG